MRELVRAVAPFCVAWLFTSMGIGSNGDALARDQAAQAQFASPNLPPVGQIALTEKQIKGLLAASKDIAAITDNAREDINKLSPETRAKLDVVARKNGLAGYD